MRTEPPTLECTALCGSAAASQALTERFDKLMSESHATAKQVAEVDARTLRMPELDKLVNGINTQVASLATGVGAVAERLASIEKAAVKTEMKADKAATDAAVSKATTAAVKEAVSAANNAATAAAAAPPAAAAAESRWRSQASGQPRTLAR